MPDEKFQKKFRRLCPKTTFIAEVKITSPSRWKSDHIRETLLEYAVTFGDWVSIHTDPRWGGSFKLLQETRDHVETLPEQLRPRILAKGIHETDGEIYHAFDRGADYVLVVGRNPNVSRPLRCTILREATSLEDLTAIPAGFKAVWNSRDILALLKAHGSSEKPAPELQKSETFKQARMLWPHPRWLCQASHIRTIADVERDADAILVGTHLVEFIRSVLAT